MISQLAPTKPASKYRTSCVSAIALLFTLVSWTASAQIEVLDQVVAIVDDDIILATELQERVMGVRSTMESRGRGAL